MTDIVEQLEQMGRWTAPGEWTQDHWAAEAQREITRLRSELEQALANTIEECASMLEVNYPGHAWLNAACAAIRSLSLARAV